MQFFIDIALTLLYLCAFLLVCAWAWRFWMLYINQKFLTKLGNDAILLEIKLPREIMKSPVATEIALASLLQSGGVSNWYARKFLGNLPNYSSLEIASLEGVIHFYIRIDKKFRPLVEANFYAQYPGIEIVEVDDYTKMIRYHHLSKDTAMWGAHYTLGEKWTPTDPKTGEPYKKDKKDYKMRADFLPIKTYVDFGLDKDPKEEFKTDPITPLLEFMGGIGKGEYFWYQILVQTESVYDGKKMPKVYLNEVSHEHVSLKEMADARKKQLRTSHYIKKGDTPVNDFGISETVSGAPDKDGKPTKVKAVYQETKAVSKKEMELTVEEKEEIEAINKKLSKPLACVVIRIIYIAKKENQDIGRQVQNILSFPKPYKKWNSFDPNVTDPYDYPWQRIRHVEWRSEEKFDEYVEREGFFPHITERKAMTIWEDVAFWTSTGKARKAFRMIYEAIFHPFDHPHSDQISILNMEELATLWHLPGQVAATPTLPRIDSNKGVAPSNLPQ